MVSAARVYATIDQSVIMPSPIGDGFIAEWGGVEFDDDNWYNSAAKTWLTVPAPVYRAFFEFTGIINGLPDGAIALPVFHRHRNGVYLPWRGGSYEWFLKDPALGVRMSQRVGPMDVVPGDSVRVQIVTVLGSTPVSSGTLFSGAYDHKYFASFAGWAA